MALALAEFARVAARRGELEAARIRFATALELGRGLAAKREMAYALEGVAELAAGRGEGGMAVCILGAAAALRDAIGSPLTAAEAGERDRFTRDLQASLGEQESTRQTSLGRAMNFDAALEHTLRWLEASSADLPAPAG
jgi:hypothetical protein